MHSRQKREDINLFKKGNLVSSSFPKTYSMIKYYGREDIESRKSATNCHSNWCTEKWDVIFFTMITSGSNVNNQSIDILHFEQKLNHCDDVRSTSEHTRVSKQNDFTWKLSLFWNHGECKESLDMYRRIENQHSLRIWMFACDLPLLLAAWCSLRCCLAALASPAVSPTTELMLDLAPGATDEDIELLSFSNVDTRDPVSGAENRMVRSLRAQWQSQGTRNKKCNKRLCVVWRILSRPTQSDCL